MNVAQPKTIHLVKISRLALLCLVFSQLKSHSSDSNASSTSKSFGRTLLKEMMALYFCSPWGASHQDPQESTWTQSGRASESCWLHHQSHKPTAGPGRLRKAWWGPGILFCWQQRQRRQRQQAALAAQHKDSATHHADSLPESLRGLWHRVSPWGMGLLGQLFCSRGTQWGLLVYLHSAQRIQAWE